MEDALPSVDIGTGCHLENQNSHNYSLFLSIFFRLRLWFCVYYKGSWWCLQQYGWGELILLICPIRIILIISCSKTFVSLGNVEKKQFGKIQFLFVWPKYCRSKSQRCRETQVGFAFGRGLRLSNRISNLFVILPICMVPPHPPLVVFVFRKTSYIHSRRLLTFTPHFSI